MNKLNWDDVRYVLAVARHGSLNAAASALDVTHATVMRRVAAFETTHGRPLFRKSPSGYSPLPEVQAIFGAAESVEEAVLALERTILGADRSPTGDVRIASTDTFCQLLLPSILKKITERYPKIDLTLYSSNTHHDLSRLNADIIVRPTTNLPDGLVGLPAGAMHFGIYSDGEPDRKWLALDGALRRSLPARWMNEHLLPGEIAHSADSFLVLKQMAIAGLGKTLLPVPIVSPEDNLHRHAEEEPHLSVPIWVALQEEIAQAARFALVQKLLAEHMAAALGQADDV